VPPRTFLLQLLFTFYLLIFWVYKGFRLSGFSRRATASARILSKTPPDCRPDIQPRRYRSKSSLAAHQKFPGKFERSSKDSDAPGNKGFLRVRDAPLRLAGTPSPMRGQTGFAVAEIFTFRHTFSTLIKSLGWMRKWCRS
jgi:hypothetical protein